MSVDQSLYQTIKQTMRFPPDPAALARSVPPVRRPPPKPKRRGK